MCIRQMQQTIYQAKNSNSYYRIIDHCSISIGDQLTEAYIYIEADKFRSVYAHKFVQPIKEFHENFSVVLDEQTLEEIGDGISLIDRIRQGQLSDIFGKYKLF